jgi:hypothetical protein
LSSTALTRADARSGYGPRQEAGLDKRIAATLGSRLPGPRRRAKKSSRATAGRATEAGYPDGIPGNARIISPRITRYCFRPDAAGIIGKSLIQPINGPGGRPPLRNFVPRVLAATVP